GRRESPPSPRQSSVVGRPGYRDLGPSIASIARQIEGELLLELVGLLVREHIFAGASAGALKRRARRVVPDALQIRIAPRRTSGRPRLRRCRPLRRWPALSRVVGLGRDGRCGRGGWGRLR